MCAPRTEYCKQATIAWRVAQQGWRNVAQLCGGGLDLTPCNMQDVMLLPTVAGTHPPLEQTFLLHSSPVSSPLTTTSPPSRSFSSVSSLMRSGRSTCRHQSR